MEECEGNRACCEGDERAWNLGKLMFDRNSFYSFFIFRRKLVRDSFFSLSKTENS